MRRLVLVLVVSVTFAFLGLLAACNGASNIARDQVGHDGNRGFMVKTVKRGIWTRKYGLFVPLAYKPGSPQKYPVLIFLHGIGEGDGFGEGDLKNMTVGLGPAVARKAEQFQFIVIFPQSGGTWDPNSDYTADVFAALDQVIKEYPVDQDCICLTGVSTGGYGTWAIGSKYHDRFAAIVPMASNHAEAADAEQLTHTAVRAYCSVAGDIFAGWNDQSMVNRIKQLNPSANAQFVSTPTFGHDCWENVYAGDELYSWLRQQRRPGAGMAQQAPAVQQVAAIEPVKAARPAAPQPRAVAAIPVTAPAPRPVEAPVVPATPRASAPLIMPPQSRTVSSPVPPRDSGAWVNTPW